MGVDPEIEGGDVDAHGNPILGRSTMEDYLEGNAEYVTVAMDKASSWQGQYLESPNYPGVPLKVMDNGGFAEQQTGNGWVDIAFRDPEMARNLPRRTSLSARSLRSGPRRCSLAGPSLRRDSSSKRSMQPSRPARATKRKRRHPREVTSRLARRSFQSGAGTELPAGAGCRRGGPHPARR